MKKGKLREMESAAIPHSNRKRLRFPQPEASVSTLEGNRTKMGEIETYNAGMPAGSVCS
jgi:hypothetical protein